MYFVNGIVKFLHKNKVSRYMEKCPNMFHVLPLWHHRPVLPQGVAVYTQPMSLKSIYGRHFGGTPSFSLRVRHAGKWLCGIISGDASGEDRKEVQQRPIC